MLSRTGLFVLLLFCLYFTACGSEDVSELTPVQLREKVKDMFYHGYNNYLEHAFPLDELRPISCGGHDTWGSYQLTLIDAMDTLAVIGNHSEFARAVEIITGSLDFNKDVNVSLFETNIRVLGGLLSSYFLSKDPVYQVTQYSQKLLQLAEDLGQRLLPAFDTPTGIPYGTVNLRFGVPPNETTITSLAVAGTNALEFGILSRLTNNSSYEDAARRAIRGLWKYRSAHNLLGNHIDVATGVWTVTDSGIGSNADSFYEYLLKAAVFFADDEYLEIFLRAYEAVMSDVFKYPWYVDVHMHQRIIVWPLFTSLQAFWPGLQVLLGDTHPARSTLRSFFHVWQRYGFLPEAFNLMEANVQSGQRGYPLRPELVESLFYMYQATEEDEWLEAGKEVLFTIENFAKTPCGYAAVEDVETFVLRDHMDSFFLAETCKYLFLLFDPKNMLVTDEYIFNTEGHFYPIDPTLREVITATTISLQNETTTAPFSAYQCSEIPYLDRIGVPYDRGEVRSTYEIPQPFAK